MGKNFSCCPTASDSTNPDPSETLVTSAVQNKLQERSRRKFFDLALNPENESLIKLSRITDQCKARKALFEELIEQEEAHITILLGISTFFKKIIDGGSKLPDHLKRQFNVLDDLRIDHGEFLEEFKKVQNIAQLLKDDIDFVKNYSKFINEFHFTLEAITELCNQQAEIKNALRAADINPLLFKVLAKPFEYRNWTERLVNKTQRDHWQLNDLLLAQQTVQFVHESLLDAQKESERVLQTLEISKKIRGFDVKYDKHRRFILDSDCRFRTEGRAFKDGKIVIFSDLALLCNEEWLVQKSLEKYTNFERFKDVSEVHGFRLFTKNDHNSDPLEFFAATANMILHWERKLKENKK